MLIRLALVLAVLGSLGVGALPAAAANCELAIENAAQVAALGDAAARSDDFLAASRSYNAARFASIDALQQAKTCGCTEAQPQIEKLIESINFTSRAVDITNARAYGARIKKQADDAIETLRRCSVRM